MSGSTGIDRQALDALLERLQSDIGAMFNGPLMEVGRRLGLFRGLAAGGPQTAAQLAARAGTDERLTLEWLHAQVASGYVEAGDDGTFHITPEQEGVLADESSPYNQLAALAVAQALFADVDRLEAAFRGDGGIPWEEHDERLFEGIGGWGRSGIEVLLPRKWIPAIDGLPERLRAGGRVADVGCGHGHTTRVIAGAYPEADVTGFDFHADSIAAAREQADGCSFEVAAADAIDGGPYDLITLFDCLHDMGDPLGVARHLRSQIADDGVLMLCEPHAGTTLADNRTPVGRMFYAISTQVCVPCAQSQPGGLALGAQAGPARWRELLREAGFADARVVADNGVNAIYDVRP